MSGQNPMQISYRVEPPFGFLDFSIEKKLKQWIFQELLQPVT